MVDPNVHPIAYTTLPDDPIALSKLDLGDQFHSLSGSSEGELTFENPLGSNQQNNMDDSEVDVMSNESNPSLPPLPFTLSAPHTSTTCKRFPDPIESASSSSSSIIGHPKDNDDDNDSEDESDSDIIKKQTIAMEACEATKLMQSPDKRKSSMNPMDIGRNRQSQNAISINSMNLGRNRQQTAISIKKEKRKQDASRPGKPKKMKKMELEDLVFKELGIDLRAGKEAAVSKIRHLLDAKSPTGASPTPSSSSSSSSSTDSTRALSVCIPVSPDPVVPPDTPTPVYRSNVTPSPVPLPTSEDMPLFKLYYSSSDVYTPGLALSHSQPSVNHAKTIADSFQEIGQQLKQFYDQMTSLPYLTDHGKQLWLSKYNVNCQSECAQEKSEDQKNNIVIKHLQSMMDHWHKQLMVGSVSFQKKTVEQVEKHKSLHWAKLILHWSPNSTTNELTTPKKAMTVAKRKQSPVVKSGLITPTIKADLITPKNETTRHSTPKTALKAVPTLPTIETTHVVKDSVLQKRKLLYQQLLQQNNGSMPGSDTSSIAVC